MKVIFLGKRLMRGVMSTALLAVAGLAVLALGPGLMPSFSSSDAAEVAFNRPVAPAPAATQPVGANPEMVVLANWEFTSKGDKDDRPVPDKDDRRDSDKDDRRDSDKDDRGGPKPPPPPPPPNKLYEDATRDVRQALQDVNQADQQAAQALLSKNSKDASKIDANAAKSVLNAYNQLAEAAGDARSLTLSKDAQAMLKVYTKMYNDAKAGNASAVFQDAINAQKIANKAVLDASPYK